MSFKTFTQTFTFKNFQNGLHCARRRDCFWAGLSTDWMIEQVLTRSVNTSGDLTGGKGLSETQQLVWLMSMPACAEGNDANRSSRLRCAVFHQHYLITRSYHVRLISPSWLTLSGLERRMNKQPSLQERFTMFLMATLSSIAFPGHGALPT